MQLLKINNATKYLRYLMVLLKYKEVAFNDECLNQVNKPQLWSGVETTAEKNEKDCPDLYQSKCCSKIPQLSCVLMAP